ncbi:23S rRNA (adenine(2030)-N(6))-methyltransferase RlmJ [Candidatus Rickettsia kedanie]|uniref:23S rRNA (Adenine(2030)-N(6))-methyltransferase RlmJ n=1 Tax=Candidatus Rickettsia kedanie TaxID=3115352 RepID=A0ABP9TUW4_9RICK
MNYRHIYNAGNFADIVKHLVLISILEQLKKKDKPFAVLDAFSGLDLYDLNSEAASKNLESDTGINKLLQATNPILELLQTFLNIVNLAGQNHYPGSPFIIKQLLRANDRLIAYALHPSDYLTLKKLLPNDTHNIDAYNAIKAFLLFKENRGLILLDLPFEVKNEFQKLLAALKKIKLRVLNNPVLIWYPIKDLPLVRDFYHNYKNIGFNEAIIIEYELLNSDKNMVK